MKEYPILFSPPMVVAILSDLKGMTRRTNGLDEINKNPDWYWLSKEKYVDKKGRFCQKFFSAKRNEVAVCPYGSVGGSLWVRETFYAYGHWTTITENGKSSKTFYDLTIDNNYIHQFHANWQPQKQAKFGEFGWHKRSSLFMPKSISRIWLEIVSIKPQRLHDISDEDIKAEGVRIPVNGIGTGRVLLALGEKNTAIDFLPTGCLAPDATKLTQSQLLHAFWAELWCKVNGRESWDKNPWVWAIEFKVLSTTVKPAEI